MFVAEDPSDDTEGVIAFRTPDGQWIPLVCADEARLAQMRPMAERVARESGKRVRLIELGSRTDLGLVGGEGVEA